MKRLSELRKAKKLTQLRLSTMLNVSQETISGYEIGKALPPADMLIKLADVLNTSIDYLLERTDVKLNASFCEFSNEEAEIIAIYRQMKQDEQNCVYRMIKGLEY